MVAGEQEEYKRATKGEVELRFVSTLDESQPWQEPQKMLEGVDGVILGGSGEFDFDGGRTNDDPARTTSQEILARVKPLVLYMIERDFPLLGICYGHQIVGEVLGVRVVHDEVQKKIGSYPVTLTDAGKQDSLFHDTPETFIGQYGHKDSLSALPAGAVVLASSAVCKTSALRFGTHAYTTQFHPELTPEDVMRKLQNSPGYLPEGVEVDSIIKPSSDSSELIPRFIERIV
ncbi:MAG: hypothetical protein QG621_495 [Patescibacteria group bacterium]|nr:hypothetical protein [Patescibacteria group bacterium]